MSMASTVPAPANTDTLAIALAPLVTLKTAQGAMAWAMWGEVSDSGMHDVGIDLDWLKEE